MRILVAEDQATQRHLLEGLLTKWGHEVVGAENGEQARSVLGSETPPLLAVLDWMMPRVDGLQLCRELRNQSDRPYVYVILMTAKDRKQDLVQALEAGADDFLTKPFDTLEFKARLRTGQRILHLQQELTKAATHDALTGILNRGAIINFLERELIRVGREGGSVSIIMADADHFKKINDSLGHLVGDSVLRCIAATISSVVRPYDSVGRYGGEEFLIVLPGCDLQSARTRAEQIRLLISERSLQEQSVSVTLSLGVSAACEPTDPQNLLRAADEALYRAKKDGRNRVEMSSPISRFSEKV